MSPLLIGAFGLPALVGVTMLVVTMLGVDGAAGRALDRALDGWARTIAVVTVGVAFLLSLAASATHASIELPFLGPGSFVLSVPEDSPAQVVLPTVTGVATLVLLFATGDRIAAPRRFSALMMIFVAAVVVTVTAASLPVLLLAWEVMGATSYALIGLRWWDAATPKAGFIAFIVTRVGDLGLYLAAGAAVAAGTGWSLEGLAGAEEPWISVIAAGLLVAGLGKAAQLPFSFWLSRAMVGPSAASALLHSAAMVAMGAYLLLRVQPTLAATAWAPAVTALIGLATALGLGVVALGQNDLKQVLAASTASQLGFVVLAAGVGAVSSGTALLVAHAAVKSLLFVVAGAWLTAAGTRRLSALTGVARRWRTVGVAAAAGGVMLAGIPPFALWLGKDGVLAASFEVSPLLWLGGVGAAALGAAYSARIVRIVWGVGAGKSGADRVGADGEIDWDSEEEGTRSVGRITTLAAVTLTVVAVAMLAIVGPLVFGAESAPSAFELLVSGGVVVVVFAIVLRYGGRGGVRVGGRFAGRFSERFGERSAGPLAESRVLSPEAGGWLGLELTANTLVARPVLALGSVLARFDNALDRAVDKVPNALAAAARTSASLDDRLDRAVDASAPALDRAAESTRRSGEVALDGVVENVARGAGALGRRTSRLQSGDLSFYYALAVVFLGVAALVLILVGAP